MDFTGQYQFTGGQPPYQFVPVPPLTPSHSQSAPSEDYNNKSPPDPYDGLNPAADPSFNPLDYANAHHHQAFQGPQQQQPPQQQQHEHHEHHQNPAFHQAGPPTPPNNSLFGQNHSQHGGAHAGNHIGAPLGSNAAAADGVFDDPYQTLAGDAVSHQPKSEPDDVSNGRGGSEEDPLTPAQSKRKAQNRAAQRAFRERKEKHVKDLESKLADLEAARQQSTTDNERLRRDLQKMATENEILKATAGKPGGHGGHGGHGGGGGHATSRSPERPLMTGPMCYSPTDFASSILQGHNDKTFSHRIVHSDDGERMLAAGATWDFIASHDLFERGLLDIGFVSEYLRSRALCDGQGPVFPEKDIVAAMELSAAEGTDDLL